MPNILVVFNLFIIALVLGAIMQRLWEKSITTMLIISYLAVISLLLPLVTATYIIILIMLFMSHLYYRAVIRSTHVFG